MLATVLDPLLHVPPTGVADNVEEEPAHITVVPVIGVGNGFMVTITVRLQPVAGSMYVITAVPAALPVTTPATLATVATVRLLLLHVPVSGELDSRVVEPTHALGVPLIPTGRGLIVTSLCTRQPVGNIYEKATDPAESAFALPLKDTILAFVASEDSHVPIAVVLVKVAVVPTHIADVPDIGAGKGLTVTTADLKHPLLSI
jgi:hypothetical protein